MSESPWAPLVPQSLVCTAETADNENDVGVATSQQYNANGQAVMVSIHGLCRMVWCLTLVSAKGKGDKYRYDDSASTRTPTGRPTSPVISPIQAAQSCIVQSLSQCYAWP